jgi:hypothetical protein
MLTQLLNGLALIFLVVGMSHAAYVVGEHLDQIPMFKWDQRLIRFHSTINFVASERFAWILLVITTIVAIVVAIFTDQRSNAIAVLIGPFGAYLRVILSSLNVKYDSFPLGTET